jgi:hypothetical protein
MTDGGGNRWSIGNLGPFKDLEVTHDCVMNLPDPIQEAPS